MSPSQRLYFGGCGSDNEAALSVIKLCKSKSKAKFKSNDATFEF